MMFPRAVAAVALAAAVLVTGAGTASASTPSVAPALRTAPTGTVVMIIRHAEEPDGSAEGIDANGQPDDHSLTPAGWQRARALVGLFRHPHPGLVTPTRIYAAGATEKHSGLRPRETVAPLAAALHLPVTTSFGRKSEGALAAQVTANGGPTLISWQHKGIPDIVDAFPGVTPAPPSSWPDDRFDVVWTLTKTPTGWHFAQTPEQVMPRDGRGGI